MPTMAPLPLVADGGGVTGTVVRTASVFAVAVGATGTGPEEPPAAGIGTGDVVVGVSGWATIGPEPVSDGVAAAIVGAYESSSGRRDVAPLGGEGGRVGVGIGYAGAVGVCSDGLVREIDPVDNGRGGVIITSVGADEL